MTDQRTEKCQDALMTEIKNRGLIEKSVEGVEKLADCNSLNGPAFGIDSCHDEADDIFISRVRQMTPRKLRRMAGVEPNSEASIIVRFDETGESQWVGTLGKVNAGGAACFDALSGRWTRPRDSRTQVHTSYRRQFRCSF